MLLYVLRQTWYILKFISIYPEKQGTYRYIPLLYLSESCFTGFRGTLSDTNTLVPDVEQPPVDQENDESGKNDPCPEDEEFFQEAS